MAAHATLASAGLILATLPAAVFAQQPPLPNATAPQVDEEVEIIVTGQPQRGAVVGDIKPELQLGPADIRALGVSSVTELLAELAPQLRSGQGSGPPVVLLEGKRISGFREVASLPAEAIARVDILPEEVALKYGYPSGQKVVNIVLRQRFRAFTVELEDKFATAGGANATEGKFDFLRIQKAGRFAINLKREAADRLLESQRGIDDGTGSGQYRTLLPANRQFTAGATLSRTIFGDVAATLNGELKTDDSRATFGVPGATLTLSNGTVITRTYPVLSPLARTDSSQSAHAAASLNGAAAGWRWSFTGNYDHVDSTSFVDRGIDPTALQAAILSGDADPFGPVAAQYLNLRAADQARSVSDIAAIDFTVNGTPFKLPAGNISTTVKLGASFSGFEATSLRGGVNQVGRVTRDIADAQLNVDVPLTSRRNGFLSAIGDLSINGNAATRQLSDYGSLRTFGYGLTWSPVKQLNLIASVTDDEAAPTAQQIGNPIIATPGVRVFDFVRGETAFVTQIGGGNNALLASDRHVVKFGATLKPFTETDITLSGDYVRTTRTRSISGLPPASLASQAAFPDRYARDVSGALIRVDSRTVNFARTEASQFRWGLNFSKPLKTSQTRIDALRAAFQSRFPNGVPGRRPGGADGARADGPRAGRPGAGGQGRGSGGFGGGGGRLNFAAYHTVHLTESVTLRDGLAPIDLLRGGTIGNGGQPRHEIEVQAGFAKNGFGARLTGNWQSATRVTGLTASDDLRFSGLATANLRLFVNMAQLPAVIKAAPWLAGTRISLGINNLFDTRQHVTDGTGATPIIYSPGYLDPLGRTVRITIRKLLF